MSLCASVYLCLGNILAHLCVIFYMFCQFLMWYPGSGEVLDCIDARSLPPYLLRIDIML